MEISTPLSIRPVEMPLLCQRAGDLFDLLVGQTFVMGKMYWEERPGIYSF